MAVWRPDQQRTSTHTKPKSRQKEQEIEFARSPSSPPNASPPSLGTRFAGLPAELRAEILAWLLVRPVKWSATHMADCPLRSPELTATPFEDIRPRMVPSRATCAAADPPMRRWRHCTRPIWRDPWRSEWAPPITNEFLCSSCWDERFRSYSCPRIDSLPCLCARKRRADGFAALLVCRAWYEEGARVRCVVDILCNGYMIDMAVNLGAVCAQYVRVRESRGMHRIRPSPEPALGCTRD
ncbi:hypothetical protein GGS24DRAFT_472766 [Hypoxylon argillaceum]|nr:hypothetical protein GGS24DRAFT_472766 [Hypoxylon argillaceum]